VSAPSASSAPGRKQAVSVCWTFIDADAGQQRGRSGGRRLSAIVRAKRIKLNKLFVADAADARIGLQTADRKWAFA
jgi:hypothetical protein